MRLKNYAEVVGTLTDTVLLEDNQIIITVSMIKQIELPPDALPQKKLQSLIGKRIGIFCIDEKNFVRVVRG